MSRYRSWGGCVARQRVRRPAWASEPLRFARGEQALPFGLGRSYGDSCLNDGGTLISTAGLARFMAFDRSSGRLRCEAGVSLDAIIRLALPQGWFLPVTPGTRFVTVGGAIANDVHGKNHHRAGTFGRHVLRFELLRSDGRRLLCSPRVNPDWYGATIGGLGLTGLITWAEIQLKPVANAYMVQETRRFRNLDEFFAIATESERDFEYTVAWVDCLARGRRLGRGAFLRANHAPPQAAPLPPPRERLRSLPFPLPSWVLNRASLRGFNALYYRTRAEGTRLLHCLPYFYPLDAIAGWNRLYGRRGFFQYQCVVPHADGGEAMARILTTISEARTGSFLAVLKTFGGTPSPGMLSFPRPGVTLALDFPNRGAPTRALLDRLDEITRAAGGAVYPAKDARMSADSFQAYFPAWRRFAEFVDPQFSSGFWRRVGVSPAAARALAPTGGAEGAVVLHH